MSRRFVLALLMELAASCASCASCARDDEGFRVRELPKTPPGLPEPSDPRDNPTTAAKVTLGRALFYDPRLSTTDFMSCNDCHNDAHAWAGRESKSVNAMGKRTRRKAPTVLNAAYLTAYTWDGRARTLEDAIALGWGQLGMTDPEVFAQKLAAIPAYRALFQDAFGAPPSGLRIEQALGAYLRALKSGNSPYDRFVAGDESAMSAPARRGLARFGQLGCSGCHPPPLFTDWKFHAVGVGGEPKDGGRGEQTKLADDEGRFRTPSLRDVATTGPWFHDGSASTLDDTIVRMAGAQGGHDPLLLPRTLTPAEVAEIRAFLESLTGTPTLRAPERLPDGKKPS
jgi:cytochrome c peroxidase